MFLKSNIKKHYYPELHGFNINITIIFVYELFVNHIERVTTDSK